MSKNTNLRRAAPPRGSGFTLIEMMVVLAIAVIMSAVAVPSFQGALLKYRIDKQQRGLRDLLQLAHDNAAGTQALTICSSANGTSCSPDTDWQQGQIVFVDGATIGVVDGNDEIIQHAQPVTGGVPLLATLEATGADYARGFIHFDQGTPDIKKAVRFTACYHGDKPRQLSINVYGHIWSSKGSSPCA
jgi:type IV fimbrial biogenesis protein FimT